MHFKLDLPYHGDIGKEKERVTKLHTQKHHKYICFSLYC